MEYQILPVGLIRILPKATPFPRIFQNLPPQNYPPPYFENLPPQHYPLSCILKNLVIMPQNIQSCPRKINYQKVNSSWQGSTKKIKIKDPLSNNLDMMQQTLVKRLFDKVTVTMFFLHCHFLSKSIFFLLAKNI